MLTILHNFPEWSRLSPNILITPSKSKYKRVHIVIGNYTLKYLLYLLYILYSSLHTYHLYVNVTTSILQRRRLESVKKKKENQGQICHIGSKL